jgi:pimeloyl-ACP methyl ester carboxylesterase
MPEDYTFQSPWEDYFTVVEWDQRGAGKTYTANDPNTVAPTMTLEQMTSDAEEVVRYLQKTYSKKKIILMGHSWGSILGVRLSQAHPEWFYAYVGVGQIVNMRKSEKIGYDFVLAAAKDLHNEEAVKQLEALAPYPGDVGGLDLVVLLEVGREELIAETGVHGELGGHLPVVLEVEHLPVALVVQLRSGQPENPSRRERHRCQYGRRRHLQLQPALCGRLGSRQSRSDQSRL